MALPKKNRLTTKKDIDHVFRNGRTVRGIFLFIRFLKNQKGYPRFAFIVPTKHASLAVDRNKIRRVFSEKIRKNPGLFDNGYDVAVVASKKIERKDLQVAAAELVKLLLKLVNNVTT